MASDPEYVQQLVRAVAQDIVRRGKCYYVVVLTYEASGAALLFGNERVVQSVVCKN